MHFNHMHNEGSVSVMFHINTSLSFSLFLLKIEVNFAHSIYLIRLNSLIPNHFQFLSSPLPAAPRKSYITITAKCLQIAFININPRQSKFLYYRNNL